MCAVEVTPVVSTERLILRGPVASDAAAMDRTTRIVFFRMGLSSYDFVLGVLSAL